MRFRRLLSKIETLSGIEIEFNPFSLSSKCASAVRTGRMDVAIRLGASVQDGERFLAGAIRYNLPDWPARQVLIDTTRELVGLSRSAEIARRAGVAETIATDAALYAEETGAILWRTVEKLAAVAAQGISSARAVGAIERQGRSLEQLLDAVRELRDELVEATLSPGLDHAQIASAEAHLRGLIEAAKTAREWLDETTA